MPYAWLLERGHLQLASEELVDEDTEVRARKRLLQRVRTPWKLELLSRYEHSMLVRLARWRERGWKGDQERFTQRAVTIFLRAAWRFLEELDPEIVSVHAIDRLGISTFVAKYPGHHHALTAFIGYLNRKERLFQKLPMNTPPPGGLPFHDLLTASRFRQLTQRWLECADTTLRDSLLCLFILLYARTGRQACSLQYGHFRFADDGVHTKFGTVEIQLQPKVAAVLRRYVSQLEAAKGGALSKDDALFPGLVPGRHLTEGGLQYILGKQGVTANQLYTTGLVSHLRAGLSHPKVLVQALGITNQTAAKYWQGFHPRVIDEMKQQHDLAKKT